MKRTPFGEKVRQRVQHEAAQATALEGDTTRLGLFQLHHVDWLHIETPQRDKGTLKAGAPDYFLLGDGWNACLEIKAHVKAVKYMGKLSASQHNFHDRLRRAGVEVWTAWLPDDLGRINEWLQARTGIVVNIDGLLAREGATG